MRNRGGMPAFKILMTVVCLALAGGAIWLMLPDWIARPNAEASSGQYQDAASVPVNPNDDTGLLGQGKCPALTMAVAKALADHRLTKGEAHDLGEQADALSKEATAQSAKNSALEQVGQKPAGPVVNCPQGSYLFRF